MTGFVDVLSTRVLLASGGDRGGPGETGGPVGTTKANVRESLLPCRDDYPHDIDEVARARRQIRLTFGSPEPVLSP